MTDSAAPTDASFAATRLPALIGAGFGLVFALINARGLPAPWPLPVRLAGVMLTATVVTRVLLARLAPAPRPEPTAIRTYWRWVAIEGIAIVAGTMLLSRFGLGAYGVLWVIAVVGVHFLPFATAFRRREYRALGWVLIALALVGVVLGVVLGSTGTAITGVSAGAVLLVFALTFGTGRSVVG